MTDLEMIKKCAEKMGIDFVSERHLTYRSNNSGPLKIWTPLHDDAQAMALVKKFNLNLNHTLPSPENHTGDWMVSAYKDMNTYGCSGDLNRAIVECVAKLP
jgi:hypothetical protein